MVERRAIGKSRGWGRVLSALIASLAFGGLISFAANPFQPVRGDPLLESWRWRTFPELSGLGAHCMAEGTDGTIWFGTVEGVRSYDGITWAYHPADQVLVGSVTTVCPAPDGILYVGGRSGMSRFDHGKWTGLFPGTGKPFGEIRKLIVARDGSLWAATAWGVLRFHRDRWTCYTDAATTERLRQDKLLKHLTVEPLPMAVATRSRPGSPPVNRQDFAELAEDASGRLWLGTTAGEIITFDPADGTWALYNEADGLVCGRNPSILPLANGTVWVVYGSGSGHVNVFDGVAWKPLNLTAADVPGDASNLLQTRDGVIWLSGRYVISAYRDGYWRNYQQPEVPIPTARNFLLQSADGALWIGGPGTEIQRVDYGTPRWLTLYDLNFQWESPAGAAWFLHRDGRVIVEEGGQWTAYGAEDGLIDAPVALVGARNGEVWVAGSHRQTAATARFDGRQWNRFLHDEFSWGVDWRGVLATADGSVWFAAAVDSSGAKEHRHGLLQYRDGAWSHHHQPGRASQNGNDANPATLLPATQRPEPIGKFLALGESRDGKIWAGRNILIFQSGGKWSLLSPTPDTRYGIIETLLTTRERDLWIGTRQYGALRYDGQAWQRHQGKDSLVANSVRSLAQTADGSIWAATDRDVSRFDGRTWLADLLPASMNVPSEGGSLKAAPSGALWINRFSPDWNRRAWSKATPPDPAAGFWTVRHQFQGTPPQTTLAGGSDKISPPGNLSVLWSGTSRWREPKDTRLQYSFRLDDQPWSPYTADRGHAFFSLPAGRHRFEVRARDQDFNVDPTPAVLDFTVLPPVWRQAWFILLMFLLGGLIATQTIRVFLERGRLRRTNRALATEIDARRQAAEEIRQLNASLEQRVAERTSQLAATNQELESFSYSVSHDLRAPLRSIDGFSGALLEDYAPRLDAEARDFLNRIRAASQRMGLLIDDLLQLSRVTRDEMRRGPVDLSALAGIVADELRQASPGRAMEFVIAPGLMTHGDARLLQLALENLLGNAVKFSARRPVARIEFGCTERAGGPAFFVRDNGAGFDQAAAAKLFGAFQRFHTTADFPGTGIGLATVQRIIHRHGGRLEAESRPDHGATFYFTLPGQPHPAP
jgi:signal transduction histidine kinase